jgi:hypothetical protein
MAHPEARWVDQSLEVRMRSRLTIPALAIAAFMGSPSWAVTEFDNPSASPSGAHYRQGFGEPVCTLGATSVTCTETQIAGIGNLDGDVVLSVISGGTCVCTNGGGQVVEVKAQLVGTTSGDNLTRNRNGTLIVSEVTAGVPTDAQLLAQTDCPKADTKNKNWTKSLSDRTTSYTYTLTMEGFQDPIIHQP